MGKLKALRLGIVKGIQHATDFANPRRALTERISARLVCIQCKHPSNSHSRVRPKYQGLEGRTLYEAILQTGSKGSGGFAECVFYDCDDCEIIATEGDSKE